MTNVFFSLAVFAQKHGKCPWRLWVERPAKWPPFSTVYRWVAFNTSTLYPNSCSTRETQENASLSSCVKPSIKFEIRPNQNMFSLFCLFGISRRHLCHAFSLKLPWSWDLFAFDSRFLVQHIESSSSKTKFGGPNFKPRKTEKESWPVHWKKFECLNVMNVFWSVDANVCFWSCVLFVQSCFMSWYNFCVRLLVVGVPYARKLEQNKSAWCFLSTTVGVGKESWLGRLSPHSCFTQCVSLLCEAVIKVLCVLRIRHQYGDFTSAKQWQKGADPGGPPPK